jgi:hypothetical protein
VEGRREGGGIKNNNPGLTYQRVIQLVLKDPAMFFALFLLATSEVSCTMVKFSEVNI